MGPPFLRRWHDFLAALQKNIKSTEIEDQNVKVRCTTGSECFSRQWMVVRDGRQHAVGDALPAAHVRRLLSMYCLQMLSTVYDVEYKNVVDGLNPMLV